jgi:hypothetical protein
VEKIVRSVSTSVEKMLYSLSIFAESAQTECSMYLSDFVAAWPAAS